MSVIPAALDIAEDLILPALRVIDAAWWGVVPAGTVGRLLRPPDDAQTLRRCYVAQHQDGGGQFAPRLRSAGWRGEIVIRCLAGDDRAARDGRDRAHTAMLALVAPDGYAAQTQPLPPLAIPSPDADGIYTRATRYRLVLRRAA